MSARRRTPRGELRRRLGQNFLEPDYAEALVEGAELRAGELVVELGAGAGAITRALARRGVEVLAVEIDPEWAALLRDRFRRSPNVRVVRADMLSFRMPGRPFRVLGSVPFGRTTDILHRLLDDPGTQLQRADLVLQWEVARKRAAMPPASLLSTAWAPWWTFELGERLPAAAFRPVPRVAAGTLIARRRDPPLLPEGMAGAYLSFVRDHWPFACR